MILTCCFFCQWILFIMYNDFHRVLITKRIYFYFKQSYTNIQVNKFISKFYIFYEQLYSCFSILSLSIIIYNFKYTSRFFNTHRCSLNMICFRHNDITLHNNIKLIHFLQLYGQYNISNNKLLKQYIMSIKKIPNDVLKFKISN